jgi:hypothetical protein
MVGIYANLSMVGVIKMTLVSDMEVSITYDGLDFRLLTARDRSPFKYYCLLKSHKDKRSRDSDY